MALTRASVETVLVRRVGAWLTFVSLDGTTHTGSNADLADPIATALLLSGYAVADITNPSDADLALVAQTDQLKILDVAEYRTLETILQQFTDSDVKGLTFATNDDQFGTRVLARLTKLQATLLTQYGIGLQSAAPYAGGISRSDKRTQSQNTDRVKPDFTKNLQKAPGTRQPSTDWYGADEEWWP